MVHHLTTGLFSCVSGFPSHSYSIFLSLYLSQLPTHHLSLSLPQPVDLSLLCFPWTTWPGSLPQLHSSRTDVIQIQLNKWPYKFPPIISPGAAGMCGSSLGTRQVGGWEIHGTHRPRQLGPVWESMGAVWMRRNLGVQVCVCVGGGWVCSLGATVGVGVREAGQWVGDSRPLSVSLPGTRPQGHFKSAHPKTETPIRPLSDPAKSSQVKCVCACVHLCMCVCICTCVKMYLTGSQSNPANSSTSLHLQSSPSLSSHSQSLAYKSAVYSVNKHGGNKLKCETWTVLTNKQIINESVWMHMWVSGKGLWWDVNPWKQQGGTFKLEIYCSYHVKLFFGNSSYSVFLFLGLAWIKRLSGSWHAMWLSWVKDPSIRESSHSVVQYKGNYAFLINVLLSVWKRGALSTRVDFLEMWVCVCVCRSSLFLN